MILKGIDWKNVKLLDIVEGCFGSAYSDTVHTLLKKETTSFQLSKGRLEICSSCDLYNNGQCNPQKTGEVVRDFTYHGEPRKKGELRAGCGCKVKCKTTLGHESCPLGKWLKVEN